MGKRQYNERTNCKRRFQSAPISELWNQNLHNFPNLHLRLLFNSNTYPALKDCHAQIRDLCINYLKLLCTYIKRTARFNFALNALLNNGLTFVTRKLFGQYALISFLKSFGIVLSNWVNGIILICLTTKITVIKYRTLRIIIFKKKQINKVLIIALLKINNFPQRKRVANIYIKRKKSNVRFGGKFIGIKSVAAAFIARFTLFFGGGFFAAAVKARRGVTGKTFAGILKSCKRKKAR
ncbi:hypothetical protein GGTG_00462 [Gaeumannomyces tritici R3-111a-1]|uniref:Uncharacterized protein n=1 Tax=Gaeumannomyces tritici (strain R3-111a-1) TaxID=644352 RepID=J3NGS3_GAET3|nr:hypothetical protein GGTG_00462 [Gaeumannomyces tritici R3-111a-1]EJT80463.1 hypothetical protein GGTG_00462 [Gaeumannomyces tritici R3-111a-1]